jgi:hypothetical protein
VLDLRVAVPELSFAEPMTVPPVEKVTEPVGVPPVPVTFAVRVTSAGGVTEEGEAVRVVVVEAAALSTTLALAELAESDASPE